MSDPSCPPGADVAPKLNRPPFAVGDFAAIVEWSRSPEGDAWDETPAAQAWWESGEGRACVEFRHAANVRRRSSRRAAMSHRERRDEDARDLETALAAHNDVATKLSGRRAPNVQTVNVRVLGGGTHRVRLVRGRVTSWTAARMVRSRSSRGRLPIATEPHRERSSSGRSSSGSSEAERSGFHGNRLARPPHKLNPAAGNHAQARWSR